MRYNPSLNFESYIGHYTILYGEINTKKTFYTANFIQFLIEAKHFDPKQISILDFAPPLKVIKGIKIGGKIKDFYENSIICNYLYFEGEIIPPRFKARNRKELYENACKNYKKTSKLLKFFNNNPTEVLIINDISIYLHIGNKNLLLNAIENSKTFFGNSYYGSTIKSDFTSLFSLREKRIVGNLIKQIEFSYFTG
ncbi:MAG: hypothetical protein JSV62_05540 [Promethearchaeota archaeon]|nr:MAG: hypothetical protein JSV62_05540 [Candidatus Lokiarchaeota archaeon]